MNQMNDKMRHQSSASTAQEKLKVNKASSLLTSDENDIVFSLLGKKCLSLSTAVIQLYITESSSAHSHWRKKHTAVLCFIKDNTKRSYFLRAYCLIRKKEVWEHEIYDNLEIYKTRPFLVTFEGQHGHVAFNFASETECEDFFKLAKFTIENRNRKREDRKNRIKTQIAPAIPPAIPPPNKSNHVENIYIDDPNANKVQLRKNPLVNTLQLTPAPSSSIFTFNNTNNTEKKKVFRKLRKDQISTPSNFVHITHIGWSEQNGFDLKGNEDDESLKIFFNKAGVSEQELKDRDTRAFIYDFVQNHNVIESVKSERVDKPQAPAPPPVPKRENVNTTNQNGQSQRTAPPPPPPTRQPPPPVPTTVPITRGPPPNRPPPINVPMAPVQTAVLPSVAPPPPPPLPAFAPPPPPMPTFETSNAMPKTEITTKTSAALPVISDTRNALMESIRKGANLKKIDPASLSTGSGSGDARNELLSEIRHGTTLRPVASRELPSGSFNRDSGSGGATDALADALRRALQDRGRAIHSSEDESGSSSDNDGEWED